MLSDASAVNRSGDVINPAASLSPLPVSKMTSTPPGPAFQNKRVAILAELDKKKRQLIQNQSMNTPGGSISLSRPNLKEFRDNAEQQHIAAQQKAALQHAHAHSSGFFITQDSSFGNLILPVLPRLEAAES